jgi:hypothetical protein
MSACAICSVQASRVSLSNSTTTVVAAFSAMTLAACGAAPTPLYHQYQEGFGLTSVMVTVIFADVSSHHLAISASYEDRPVRTHKSTHEPRFGWMGVRPRLPRF